tara:strand:- start:17898 stop:18500 length:603 start_codon:yes stop_codon:yes gene_type:complete
MFYPTFTSKISKLIVSKVTLSAFFSLAIFSLALISNGAQASDKKTDDLTKVYKVVGADGSVSFSDQPNEKSETVLVAPVATIPAMVTGGAKFTPQEVKSDEPYNRYSSLSILAPANESAFYSGSGDVDVLLDIKPALLESDQIQLYLDGKLIQTNNQIQARLQTMDRGTHELKVKLVSSSGKVYKESTSIFTVHRPRIRN